MAVSILFFNVLMLCALTCSIICTEHREAEEDINKCNDGVCLAKDSFIRDDLDKLHNYQDDAALESQLILHTMTTVEMYREQREVAQYLEMAILMSADHADVAKEIRITAHESRSQHLMTSGLMKNFAVTALDIVSRKIPKLFVGLKMKKPTVIKTILNQILATAEEMKKETELTRKRYYDLQGQVQNNIITVNTKTNDNRKKSDELKVRMEKEKQQAKLAKEQEYKLGKTKADLDKDIQNLKQKRDNLYGSVKREQENRKDHTLTFGHSMGGIGFILDLFGNIFTHIFGGNDNYYQEIMKQYREADESLRRTMEGQEDIIDQILDMRAKALSSLENLKKMARQQDGLGDITHLREVDRYLGNVDKEFTKILTYWENMAATIKYLRDDIVDSSTFVDEISEPDGETQFREDLIRTEKNWKFFGKICSAYIEESDKEVFTLYRFLSEPIDNKSAEAIRKRQDDIIAQIENDINSALPSMDD